MAGSVKIQISGAKELISQLRHLQKESTAGKILRRAVNLATTPILQAARQECPVDQGDLRRAQTKKVSGKRLTYNGIVGADANYVGEDGSKPSHYDHLVEDGHVAPDGTVVPPTGYLRRAWDQSIATAQAKYETTLAEGIEKEVLKAGE